MDKWTWCYASMDDWPDAKNGTWDLKFDGTLNLTYMDCETV